MTKPNKKTCYSRAVVGTNLTTGERRIDSRTVIYVTPDKATPEYAQQYLNKIKGIKDEQETNENNHKKNLNPRGMRKDDN